MVHPRLLVPSGLPVAVAVALTLGLSAQEPRFRGGTNLVRLDVYVSKDGTAVTDLTAADFEVLEDNAPQTVSSFELIRTRGAGPESARVESATVAEMRSRAAQADARAFVLFLDTLHVQLEGSYRATSPVGTMLDRLVGEDDLVGVMTPEMSARNMTFSPRSAPIAEMMRANWAWGERGSLTPTDPRENDLRLCYPDAPGTEGIASALIERRREQRVIAALSDLVGHLEGLRDERTFVLLLTEGWTLPRADERLAAPLRDRNGERTGPVPGGPEPIGVTPDGRLARAEGAGALLQSCERERSLLALSDLEMEFRQATQRANRANVSFYPIDPRGLVVFDAPIGPGKPPLPSQDASQLRRRQDALRQLADETDGAVVLNTSIDKALPRLLTDIGSYYLLGYVSTNAKLDGRYRRLTVRVSRPGVSVRSRPGYLAPSAAEVAAASPVAAPAGARRAPSTVGTALSRLPVSRRPPSVHLQAGGGRGDLQVVVELDRTTASAPEWGKGGSLQVDVEPADGATGRRTSGTAAFAPGERVRAMRLPESETLRAGRYQVRVQATAAGARSPIVVSTVVDVPGTAALLGSAPIASRRGPGTGRVFEPTADARFRRTERLSLEVPRLSPEAVLAARLLNRAGQPMQVPVTLSERPDDARQLRLVVADVMLAPLAAGEYVIEITATAGSVTETLSYGLRIVP